MTATLLVTSLNSIDSIDAMYLHLYQKKASQVKSLVLSTERMTSAQILPQLNCSINKLIIVFPHVTERIISAMYDDDETIEAIRITVYAHHFRCYWVCQLSLSVLLSTGYLAGAIVALAQLALHCHPPQWANEIGSNAHRRSRRTPQRFCLQVFHFQSSELTPAGSAQWFMSCVNIWNSKDSNIHLTQLR